MLHVRTFGSEPLGWEEHGRELAVIMDSFTRSSSFLPTIKCSNCNASIEISLMGDHVCSNGIPRFDDSIRSTSDAETSQYLLFPSLGCNLYAALLRCPLQAPRTVHRCSSLAICPRRPGSMHRWAVCERDVLKIKNLG